MSGEEQKEKKVPTYVAIRYADKMVKEGDNEVAKKRQINLFFHGGKDKRGNPILSNDEHIAFVEGRNLAIFPTDKDGKIKMFKGADGKEKQADPVRRNMESAVAGALQGLDSKSLKVGEATIVGPEKDTLMAFFNAAIAAAAQAKAERAAANPTSDSPSP